MQCPHCGNENDPDAAFCDNCGTPLSGAAPLPPQQPAAVTPAMAVSGNCPQCGQPVITGEAFCGNCGAALEDTIPSARPVHPPQPVPPPQPTPAAAPGGGVVTCPSCGHQVPPGALFCDNCGVSLSGIEDSLPSPQVQQLPRPTPPAAPRLVVQSSHASLPFPAGQIELIVGREDPVSNVFPDINLEPHGGEEGGVSRRHAKFAFQGGQWYIQDLNSTNFTFVNKQKLQPDQPHPLNNGDEIRLGRVEFTFEL